MRKFVDLIIAIRVRRAYRRQPRKLLAAYLQTFNRSKIYTEHDDRFRH